MRKQEEPFLCPCSENKLQKKKKNILCTTEKNKCPLREEMGAIPMEIEVFFEKKLQFFAGYPCIQNMFCL